jgi:hypothetical protein
MNATNLARMIPHQIHGPSGIIGELWDWAMDFNDPMGIVHTTPTQAVENIATQLTGTTPSSAPTFGSALGSSLGNALTWVAIIGAGYLIFKSEITRK